MKKLYFKRYLYFWLYALFCIGVPIILIAEEYELISKAKEKTFNISIWGMISFLLIIFFLRKQVKIMIGKLEPSKLRTFLENIGGVIPIILIYLILHVMKPHIHRLEVIAFVSIFSYVISVFFLTKHTEYEL